MAEKLYPIFNTDIWQYDEADIRSDLSNYYDEVTDDMILHERYKWVAEDAETFWDEMEQSDGYINYDAFYIKADLGLWDGRKSAWAIENSLSGAIHRCVDGMDDWKIEETSRGKLIVTGYHHDGVNHYEIYVLRRNDDGWHRKPAKRELRNVHLRKALRWI